MEEVVKALLDGYDKSSLTQMLAFRLNKNLGVIVADGPLKNVVFDLMVTAEREGWDFDLVREAYRANPGNRSLLKVYEKFGIAPKIDLVKSGAPINGAVSSPSSEGLEKVIRDDNPTLDIHTWLLRLTEVESRVCRIDIEGRPKGTGFLVGPEVVLTNFHVVEDIVAGKKNSASVSCLFDYKVLPNNKCNLGSRVQVVAEQGVLVTSPYSSAEKAGKPNSELPTQDELDFALLRLARPFAHEPIHAPRGYEVLPAIPVEIKESQGIIIAQHPAGAPMKLAIDTQSVISVNANSTRVCYKTNTEGGSSGSPVFDMLWNLSALHHYGDPSWNNPMYNQGVLPLYLIRAKIEDSGFGKTLG
ncbi:MAG: trypsin-like peptidase domain-containing protein [Methylococcales bacterium]